MIPISDDNETLRTPIVNWAIIGVTAAVWVLVQGAGFDPVALAASVCNYGLVPGEVTGRAPVGLAVPLGHGLLCVVDREWINWFTPLISLFLHGSWAHLLGNLLFLHVFGDDVEDSMGRGRYLAFYLLCGVVAAASHALMIRKSNTLASRSNPYRSAKLARILQITDPGGTISSIVAILPRVSAIENSLPRAPQSQRARYGEGSACRTSADNACRAACVP